MLYNARKTRGRYKYQTEHKNAQDGAKNRLKTARARAQHNRQKQKHNKNHQTGARIMQPDRATATRQTKPQTAKTKQTERAKRHDGANNPKQSEAEKMKKQEHNNKNSKTGGQHHDRTTTPRGREGGDRTRRQKTLSAAFCEDEKITFCAFL